MDLQYKNFINYVIIKDQLYNSLKVNIIKYLEDILVNHGKVIMVVIFLMIKLLYSHWVIKLNIKLKINHQLYIVLVVIM